MLIYYQLVAFFLELHSIFTLKYAIEREETLDLVAFLHLLRTL